MENYTIKGRFTYVNPDNRIPVVSSDEIEMETDNIEKAVKVAMSFWEEYIWDENNNPKAVMVSVTVKHGDRTIYEKIFEHAELKEMKK